MSRREASAIARTPPARAVRAQEHAVLRRVGPLVQLGSGWEWRAITARDVRSAIARSRVFVSGSGVDAAAVLGSSSDGSLTVAAAGGRARVLTDLLRGLRGEAHRRKLEHVALYVSSATEARAARAAGYTRSWSGEIYLFEKRV
jgi:hypothetical protein